MPNKSLHPPCVYSSKKLKDVDAITYNTIMTSCIVPTSLVMRACKCFYCSNDDTGFVSVYPDDHLFGILYCDTHKADALRDCCAYLHVNQQVLLEDAHRNSQLRDIVVFLMSNSVHIRRTNGISEPGLEAEPEWVDSLSEQ